MDIFICAICKKEFDTNRALSAHVSASHKEGPRYSVKRKLVRRSNENSFQCNFCKRIFANAGANKKHEISCEQNPKRRKCGGKTKGSKGHNQYTKATALGLEKPFIENSTRKKLSIIAKNRIMSDNTKRKLSEIAIKNGLGGVTQSRWINYNGKTLGSSYELSVAVSLDENNVLWDTCKRIKYIDPFGKNRTYTPDFYLEEYDVYLDPKNDFLIENINPRLGFSDIEKINLVQEQNDIKVIILNKNELDWKTIKKRINADVP